MQRLLSAAARGACVGGQRSGRPQAHIQANLGANGSWHHAAGTVPCTPVLDTSLHKGAAIQTERESVKTEVSGGQARPDIDQSRQAGRQAWEACTARSAAVRMTPAASKQPPRPPH